jgi:hypothetical protein
LPKHSALENEVELQERVALGECEERIKEKGCLKKTALHSGLQILDERH